MLCVRIYARFIPRPSRDHVRPNRVPFSSHHHTSPISIHKPKYHTNTYSYHPRPPPQACEDALHRLYLSRTPPHEVHLPTSTFLGFTPDALFSSSSSPSSSPSSSASEPLEAEFIPGSLGESEVLLGSAGRSGIRSAERPRMDAGSGDSAVVGR